MSSSRVAAASIGLLVGGWMIFDGVHVMRHGKYFGPDHPGPWSLLFSTAGVDPLRLGPLFVVLGTLWLLFLVAMLGGWRWGWYGATVVAVLSLWYLPLGTLLAVLYLGLLVFGDRRASQRP